jgi:site-specific DNA-methyltransferase (adenine-specific)
MILNTIITGRAEVALRRLEAGSVPLFIFSPPYNLNQRATLSGSSPGITRGVRLKKLAHSAPTAAYGARGGHGKWKNGTAYDGTADALPWPEYIAWQQDVLRACWRLLPDDGAIFYVHKPRVQNGESILPTRYVPDEAILRQVIIWRRAGGVNMTPTHFMPTHEWVLLIAKPGFRLKSKGASGAGDVWDIPQEPNTWHPAPFPHALVARILEAVRRPALVCDPFMGSGTVARVCSEWGIPWLGIEKSPAYAARALRELNKAEERPVSAWGGDMFAELEAA